MNNRRIKILSHISFWIIILFISFSGESWQYGRNISWSMFVQFMCALFIMAGVCYFNTLVLIPQFFKKKKYIRYIVFLILLVFAGGVSIVALRNVLINLGIEIPPYWKFKSNDYVNYLLHITISEFLLILLTSFFYIAEELIKLQNTAIKLKDIEKEKIRAQLQELKAQINPHFLFNTLNNIYSHSLIQSLKTPEMILKVSDLMSYILYECNEDKVFVENELNFIRNYVDLEKLRYEDQIDISLTIEDSDKEKRIAPLLFIPFVENAFKHGGNIGKENIFIKINIRVDSEKISLFVCNSTGGDINAKNDKGIGIDNVKKRLNLLYENAYLLEFEHKPDLFFVKLELFEHGN